MMKKFLTVIAASLLSLGAFAAETDNFYVGGSIGVLHNSTTDVTTAKILPEIGYNLNKAWAVGTVIGYSYVGNSHVGNHSFEFDPYARFTYYKNGIVSLFVDGGIDLSLGSTKVKHGGDSDTSATVGIGFKPGIALNLNERFSIVAHTGLIGYTYANDAAKSAGKFSGGGLDLYNAPLTFGLYYNF